LEDRGSVPTTVSKPALVPIQTRVQRVPDNLSLGVKRSMRKSYLSPPSSTEAKNAWSYVSTPQYVFMAWNLVKHNDNFTVPYLTLPYSCKLWCVIYNTD